MSFIDLRKKTVQVKIVYYGPEGCGKTTTLRYISNKYNEQVQSEMISLNPRGDRTVFFDFLPFEMGKVKDFDLKVQLYTVPGQVKYDITRKLVLNGVDGLVFMADVRKEMREKNIRSLELLRENLRGYHRSLSQIPLVLQYNKVDLPDQGVEILPTSVLEQDLNSQMKAPSFEASAVTGCNVMEALGKIIMSTMASMREEIIQASRRTQTPFQPTEQFLRE